jgi:hypothetical protein
MVLKKPFLADERKYLGPLMRFAFGDVRDLIVSHKLATDLRIGATEPCKSGADTRRQPSCGSRRRSADMSFAALPASAATARMDR